MTLIEQIKSDALRARKDRATAVATLLITLISEAEMVGKNAGNRQVTDVEVVAIIKKFIKNLDETIVALGDNDPRTLICIGEKATLGMYLPKQFDEQELSRVLAFIILETGDGQKNMGKVMGLLKARFDGQYDGKMASALVKKLLV